MHKINRLVIDGFRRLLDVDLKMKPFMALIGANGVGKTSLLDAFALLSASASGNLSKKISELGGLESILTRGKAEEVSFLVGLDIPEHDSLKYAFRLCTKGLGYEIPFERLSEGDLYRYLDHIHSHDGDIQYYNLELDQRVRPYWEHNPFETALSQVPKMFRQADEFRRSLISITQYHVLNVDRRSPVKLPQQMKPADLPGADGEDLIPLLYNLRESDRDRFEVVEDTLRAAFPDFESLSFPPVAAGMLAMTWKDKKYTKPLYMNELSEGTLRFLWLVALLQSPGISAITMIDEPEVSLHPELLSLLADLMREASKRTQIVVATHSDRLVSFLKPEEVVVMDIDEEGEATAKWADTLDLDEWLKEYSLDELWRSGRMGGRS